MTFILPHVRFSIPLNNKSTITLKNFKFSEAIKSVQVIVPEVSRTLFASRINFSLSGK
jgi:hypothetical protein